MAFQTLPASTDVYKCSFFPQTLRDWNDFPDSLISSAEVSDESVSQTVRDWIDLPDSLISSAEVLDDCVSMFTSLVRARD